MNWLKEEWKGELKDNRHGNALLWSVAFLILVGIGLAGMVARNYVHPNNDTRTCIDYAGPQGDDCIVP